MEKTEKPRPDGEGYDSDGLFAKLKLLRSRLASEANVPAYIVFSDATLLDMCRLRPANIEEFLAVSGVGRRKAERYGELFCSLIRENSGSEQEEKGLFRNEKYLFNEVLSSRQSAPREWTPEEEAKLSREFAEGVTIADIARAHKRTKGAIKSRLRKMGIIS